MAAHDPGLIVHDEQARLESLAQYGVLDTPPRPEFDDIVELAAAICGTSIATITLVDENRQWFKARLGLSIQETPRVLAFCAHTILQAEPLIVHDTLLDRRFFQNPLVTGSPFLRFYAGVPLINPSGFAVGTLAVMDKAPRQLNDTQVLTLKVLAQQAMHQLESTRLIARLGQAVQQRERTQAELRQAHEQLAVRVEQRSQELAESNAAFARANLLYRSMWETTTDAVLIADAEGKILYANPGTLAVLGYPPERLVGQNLAMFQGEHHQIAHVQGMQRYLSTGQRTLDWRSTEVIAVKADGSETTVEVAFSEVQEAGELRFIGFIRDVSERKRHEQVQRELARSVEEARAQLAEAQTVAKIGSWDVDVRAASMRWSDEMYRIFEIEKQDFSLTYAAFMDLVHPEDRESVNQTFRASLRDAPGVLHQLEHRRLGADGTCHCVQQRWRIFYDEHRRPLRGIGTAQDITERKAEQDRLLRLSRMHEVLSGVNSLIARASSRQELFEGCCRIAAEHGRFGAAWIDAYDPESRQIHPVARNGLDAGHVVPGARSADPEAGGSLGLAARAVLSGEIVLSNDFSSEPPTGASRPRAIEHGYRSGIALPLTVNGEIAGTLSLLAKEAEFFDPDEVKLLDELASDISLALDRLAKLDQIRYLAHYDVLTGLPNRALLAERLGSVLEQAHQKGDIGVVVQLDVQRLHDINDTFGRHRGDDLLKLVGQRLRDVLGEKSPIARIAGDHFVFVLSGLRDPNSLAHGVQLAINSCFGEPFWLDSHKLHVTARAGVAVFPQDGDEVETLLKHSETALNQAKAEAARFLFYAPRMNAQVAATLLLESRLRTALEREEFVLHYQPKFDSASGAMTGVEGLIRWNDPDSGTVVPPLEIIPILEESGLILDVGEWVLNVAVADYKRWRELVPNPPRIAINVSALQLRQDDFVDMVRRGVSAAEGADHGLDLEITESVLMTQVESNIEKLDRIRQMGVQVAIDDFGTGYSSLLYLAKLPLDTLKVDRSFILRMPQQESDRAIVSTIVSLAHQLGLKVVAEGVDTTDQACLLADMKCDEMQGFLFSEPLPADAIDRLIRLGPIMTASGAAASA